MAERTPLTSAEVEQIAVEYPALPTAYLQYMRDFGWGVAPSGHMIYGGPTSLDDVFPQFSEDRRCVLIGDDMQGYCLAYDFASKRFGEFSDGGIWSCFDEGFDLAAYLNRDAA